MSNKNEFRLSKVLADFHEFIIENNYTKKSHDGELIAFEFMSMDYDEQPIKKATYKSKGYFIINDKYIHRGTNQEIVGRELEILKELIEKDKR